MNEEKIEVTIRNNQLLTVPMSALIVNQIDEIIEIFMTQKIDVAELEPELQSKIIVALMPVLSWLYAQDKSYDELIAYVKENFKQPIVKDSDRVIFVVDHLEEETD